MVRGAILSELISVQFNFIVLSRTLLRSIFASERKSCRFLHLFSHNFLVRYTRHFQTNAVRPFRSNVRFTCPELICPFLNALCRLLQSILGYLATSFDRCSFIQNLEASLQIQTKVDVFKQTGGCPYHNRSGHNHND
ncbi:hypothetical protein D3C85_1399780 [compost metagenome]